MQTKWIILCGSQDFVISENGPQLKKGWTSLIYVIYPESIVIKISIYQDFIISKTHDIKSRFRLIRTKREKRERERERKEEIQNWFKLIYTKNLWYCENA